MKVNLRNAHIGAAIGAVIVISGGILFGDGDGIPAIIVLAGIFIAVGVKIFLDERDDPQRTRFR